MMEAARWNVDVILTDKTQTWLELRSALHDDYKRMSAHYTRMFLWTTPTFYSPYQLWRGLTEKNSLEKVAGPFDKEAMELLSMPPPTNTTVKTLA